ncbi:MAG: divalent-cation tolerance protein CutA [bacterium]
MRDQRKKRYRIVFMTAANEDEAHRIANALVEKKLTACVNIIHAVRSIYRWEGKIEDDCELLLIAKTTKSNVEKLIREVKKIHSYKVPEIISLAIESGNEEYLAWLEGSTE